MIHLRIQNKLFSVLGKGDTLANSSLEWLSKGSGLCGEQKGQKRDYELVETVRMVIMKSTRGSGEGTGRRRKEEVSERMFRKRRPKGICSIEPNDNGARSESWARQEGDEVIQDQKLNCSGPTCPSPTYPSQNPHSVLSKSKIWTNLLHVQKVINATWATYVNR